jgi:hypothetical protein
MSDRVEDFMSGWLSDNIHFNGFPQEEEPDPEAKILAEQCILEAAEEGITKPQLEEAYGAGTARGKSQRFTQR